MPGSDVLTASRRAALGEWSVTGLGVGLLTVTLSYFTVGGEQFSATFLRFAVPIGLSLFVVALGVWLQTAEFPADLVNVACVWSLAGGVVMGLLAGWTSVLQSMEGGPILQPAPIVLTKVAVGAFGGGLLGVYHGRLQRRTEQLAEQRNRLDEFASIVSHDLRNPMNVAQGHLQLARETGADRHFDAVADAHDRMERLVDEVLALSRRGETVADSTPVSLGTVATEAWTTVETPEVDLRVETDATVLADGRRLRALFENLFRNAVEHGSTSPRSQAHEDVHRTESDAAHQKSEISEDVDERSSSACETPSHNAVEHGSTSNRPKADNAVEHGSTTSRSEVDGSGEHGGGTVTLGDCESGFFVADDGPGIPPADRELVFEGGYSTHPNGTGFGLAIVRRIAEAHDWRIRVTESESGGARFEFVGVESE